MNGITCFFLKITQSQWFFIFAGFLQWSSIPPPALSNLRGEQAVRSWPMAVSGWFLAVSVSPFGFYLFEEKRSKCSLILAGGQPGSNGRWEKQRCQGCQKSVGPWWSNLNEPTGDTTALFASDWLTRWRPTEETAEGKFGESVCLRERNNTRGQTT